MSSLSVFARRVALLAALAVAAPVWAQLPEPFMADGQEPAKPAEKKDEKKEPPKKPALTLKPERKVEFTTDEATWLALDVSPDGKTIVFELLGDLYTLPNEGGEAKKLPVSDSAHKDGVGMAFDGQPSFSPDGKWIAFLSDRDGADNLWICKSDGTEPKQLTKEKRYNFMSPSWSADSQYVLVSRGGSEIWMYHIQGGSGVGILTSPPPQPGAGGPGQAQPARRGPVFSPDGKYLYFAQKPGGTSVYNQMSFGWEIARRDMLTGNVDMITQAQFGAVRPVISPDGRWMVYGTRFETQTGVRIRNLETGQDRWLKYPIQRDDMESAATRDLLPGYSFTPDGKDLILCFDGKIQRLNIESGAARMIPFSAKVEQDLGPLMRFQRRVEEGPVRSRLIQDPAISPNGKRVAFSAMTHLYVMDVPGGTPRRLTSGDAHEYKPAWSPDGKWLAYVTWEYDGKGHVWKINADGGSPQQLTKVDAFYTDLAISPDGERIVARRGNAYMRTRSPSEFGGLRIPLDVVWLPAAGGDVTMIVPARGLGTPHFTHEKDRIYFYSNEGLASMRYDSTDRIVHIRVTGRPLVPGQQPPNADSAEMRPDGQWALARVANQVYVLAVPQVGGTPPAVNVFGGVVPVKQLTDIGADSYGWADDGKTVVWHVGSTVFRRPFSSISFEEKKEEGAGGGRGRPESSLEEADADSYDSFGVDQEAKQEEKKDEKKEPKKPKEADPGVESFEVALDFPRAVPKGSVVLRGARVVTMKGDEVLENADIVVNGNRIAAVGARGSVQIPSGAKVYDVKGKTIVPGFVDTHAHYEMRTMGVLEPYNWSFLANLAYGVTTGLDVQTSTNDYLTYTDLVEAGQMIGPRAYSTGPGVFGFNDFQSADAARFVLEKYKKYYRNNNLKSYVVGYRQQRQWVVQAAKELELTVTTEGALDLKLDLTHVIDGFGGNEHALPIVPLYKDVVQILAQGKTSYTPTLLVLYGGPWAENYFYETTEVHDNAKLARYTPHNELDDHTKRRSWFRGDEYSFAKTAASAGKVQRAGGRIGVGGHGQLQGLGYHWEMWALAMGGLSTREVLKAATIDGAEIVGLKQDVGSIEVGKLADLLILEKNPLDDIRNTNTIVWVMKNGEIYVGDTLDQIYPVEKKLPPMWWWGDKPGTVSTAPLPTP